MTAYLTIAIGSAIGGMLRHFMTLVVNAQFGEKFPYAILIINIIGSTLIGIAASSLHQQQARQFIIIGLIGGFTTFSSFSLQNIVLMQNGEWGKAALYMFLSVALCLFGTWLGFLLTGFFKSAS